MIKSPRTSFSGKIKSRETKVINSIQKDGFLERYWKNLPTKRLKKLCKDITRNSPSLSPLILATIPKRIH